MMGIESGLVPSPSIPYTPPPHSPSSFSPVAPPPPPKAKQARVHPQGLQLIECGSCRKPIYGPRADCNNCLGAPFSICLACERLGKKKHGNCRANEYFQEYRNVLPTDRSQIIVFRYYSAIVSFPEDYLVCGFAPAFPHYVPAWRDSLQKLYIPCEGDAHLFPLWSQDMRVNRTLINGDGSHKVLVDADLHFFRRVNQDYGMTFAVQGALTTTIVVPLFCMWLDPLDVRSCMAVSRG